MPRAARNVNDGFFYHVLNRGNGKQTIFHKDKDFEVFLELMKKAKEMFPVNIFAYCLMPNHYHFLVSPPCAKNLSKWAHWFTSVHAVRYHHHHQTSGHIWQGRFKNFLVQGDDHFISVLRYVEGNPVRASLVNSALEWLWSSHRYRYGPQTSSLIDQLSLPLPQNWGEFVNQTMKPHELKDIRKCITHSLPFGDDEWKQKISEKYGIKCYPKKAGRPKKKE
jgi:putative transposase